MSKRGRDGDSISDDDMEFPSKKRNNFIEEEEIYQKMRDAVFDDVKAPSTSEREKNMDKELQNAPNALEYQMTHQILVSPGIWGVWIDLKPQGFWMLRSSPQRLMWLNHIFGWSLGIIPMDIHAPKTNLSQVRIDFPNPKRN